MAKANLTDTAAIQVKVRELDFVSRFERNWEHLREIIGIMRPIKKQPGAVLKSKYAVGTLENGKIAEGEEIPYSKFEVKEKTYDEMTIEKFSKAVTIEAISNSIQGIAHSFYHIVDIWLSGRPDFTVSHFPLPFFAGAFRDRIKSKN